MLVTINILSSHYFAAGRVPVHLLERVQHLLGELLLWSFLFSNHSLHLYYSCTPPTPSVPPCPPCHIVIESTYIQVGVDTAKVRVSRSAKEEVVAKEEKIAKEEEVAGKENLVKDEVEDVPLLKPSIKADDSDAANAIQVVDFDLSICIVKPLPKVEPQKEVSEEVKKAEEIEVTLVQY